MNQHNGRKPVSPVPESTEEGAGLIANAADHPSRYRGAAAAQQSISYPAQYGYEEPSGPMGNAQYHQEPTSYEPHAMSYQDAQAQYQQIQPHAMSTDDYEQGYHQSPERQATAGTAYTGASGMGYQGGQQQVQQPQQEPRGPRNSTQATVGQALWGQNPHQHPGGPMI